MFELLVGAIEMYNDRKREKNGVEESVQQRYIKIYMLELCTVRI